MPRDVGGPPSHSGEIKVHTDAVHAGLVGSGLNRFVGNAGFHSHLLARRAGRCAENKYQRITRWGDDVLSAAGHERLNIIYGCGDGYVAAGEAARGHLNLEKAFMIGGSPVEVCQRSKIADCLEGTPKFADAVAIPDHAAGIVLWLSAEVNHGTDTDGRIGRRSQPDCIPSAGIAAANTANAHTRNV